MYRRCCTPANITHRQNTHLSISFSAMKATKVRETLAAFQQALPPPLPFSVPQHTTRLLSTGNIFHSKGSVTL